MSGFPQIFCRTPNTEQRTPNNAPCKLPTANCCRGHGFPRMSGFPQIFCQTPDTEQRTLQTANCCRGHGFPRMSGFPQIFCQTPNNEQRTPNTAPCQLFKGTRIPADERISTDFLPNKRHRTTDTEQRTPNNGHRTTDTEHRPLQTAHCQLFKGTRIPADKRISTDFLPNTRQRTPNNEHCPLQTVLRLRLVRSLTAFGRTNHKAVRLQNRRVLRCCPWAARPTTLPRRPRIAGMRSSAAGGYRCRAEYCS